jgi:hypothetical protein
MPARVGVYIVRRVSGATINEKSLIADGTTDGTNDETNDKG